MAAGKVIGQVQVIIGNVKIIGVDGSVREPEYNGFLYEGEQVVSADADALFQIKYTALPEATAYDGIFRVLADGSVIAGIDAMDSIMSDKSLADIFDLETAAGEEGVESNSAFIPSDVVAESSVQGFGRGPNAGLADGGIITGAELFSDDLNDFEPTAEDAYNTAMEDNPNNVIGQLSGADADGNIFHFVLVDGPSEGTLILLPDGRYIYNTGDDFQDLGVGETRDVTFTYKTVESTTSEGYESDVATVTITVAGTNDQPVVENISVNGVLPGEIISVTNNEESSQTIIGGNIVQLDGEHEGSGSINYWHFTHNGGPLTIDVLTEYGGYGSYVEVDGDGEQTALDAYIYLYNDNGTFEDGSYVGRNDDSSVNNDGDNLDDGEADGSVYSYDSYLNFNYLPAGNYVLVIGGYHLSENDIQNGVNSSNNYEGPYQITFTSNSAISFNSGSSIIFETHDATDVPLADDTTDDGNNVLTGALSVYDVDTNDTHTFAVVDGSLEIDDPSGAGITADDVSVSIESVDGEWQYVINGNFTELAAGDSVTLTFKYVAIDDSGVGIYPVNPYNESDTSEPATITLTITGTNDQPIVSDINANGGESGTEVIEEFSAFGPNSGITIQVNGNDVTTSNQNGYYYSNSYDGLYGTNNYGLEIQNATADAVVTFPGNVQSFSFIAGAVNGSNENIKVMYTDGSTQIVHVADTSESNYAGYHSALVSVTAPAGKLISGFTILDGSDYWLLDGITFSSYDGVVYESNDTTDEPVVDDTVEDTTTIFEGSLATAQDDDTNDTHEYFLAQETAAVASEAIDPALITGLSVVVNATGDYTVAGNFNALAAGETATVTFNYYAVDSSGVGTGDANNESSVSEAKTVTLTITGTNDQPIVSDINANGVMGEVISGLVLSQANDIASSGEGSVAYTYFTVHETTSISIAANSTGSSSVDAYIYILRNDGELSNDDYIASDDDSGYGLNSYLHVTLEPGEYVAAVGDYYLGLDEVISGINNEYRAGEITIIFTANHNISLHTSNSFNSVFYESNDSSDIIGLDDTQEDVMTTFTGTLNTVTDDDVTDMHTYEVVTGTIAINGESVDGALATIYFNEDSGNWEYRIEGNFNYLATGENAVVTFNYVAIDDSGVGAGDANNESSVSEAKTVTLTITGTNDQPIVSDVSIDLVETTSSGNPSTDFDQTDVLTTFGGDLSETLEDDDSNDLHTYYMDGEPSVAGASGITDLNVEVNSDGSYTMSGNFNALAAGQTATVSFDYYTLDNSGAPLDGDNNNEASMSEVKTVTLTVTGTNDAPEITDSTNPNIFNGLNGEYYGLGSQINNLADFQAKILGKEPDATFRATSIDYGEMGITTHNFSNGDTYHVSTDESLQTFLKGDAHTLSADPSSTSDGGVRLTGQVELDAGDYTFKILSDDGYQIVIDGTAVATRAANQSPQTHYHSFSVESDGYHTIEIYWWDQGVEYIFQPELKMGDGDYLSFSSENFNFRAEAAASVIEAGTTDSGVVVDGIPTVSGDLNAADEDNGAVLTWSVVNPSDTYGTFVIDPNTGTWTYTLNNDLAATQALNENQIVTQVFNVLVTDEHGATDTQPVVIDIQGTNDAPTLSVFGGDNLVVNGSFENPDISSGTWAHLATGVPGWVAADQVEIWDHLNTYGYDASDGEQHAELDYNGVVDTLSQTLNLVEGKFILSFDAATRDAATKDNAFIVLWNGVQIASITEADMHETDGTWKTFTFEVDAVDGANTLMFAEESSDNYGPLLDNIQLYAATSFNETTSGIVGNVAGDDVDAGAVLTYSLDNDYGIFDIDDNGSIFVKDGQSLDYEVASSYNLDVRVTDQFGASDMKTIEVSVNNVTGTIETTVGEIIISNTFDAVNHTHGNGSGQVPHFWYDSDNGWSYKAGGEHDNISGGEGVLGWFNHATTKAWANFDLDDYRGETLTISADLGTRELEDWQDESITVRVFDGDEVIASETYTPGNGTTEISLDFEVPMDGEFMVKFSTDNFLPSQGGGNDYWNLDNFEISAQGDSILSFGNEPSGTIDFEALLVQDNDFVGGTPDSIDEIDLSTGNHNLSNITLQDVMDITDGDNVLKITGDAGDSVNNIAANGWVVDTSPTVTESGYNTYTNVDDSNVQLLIDIEIPIDVD